MNSALAAAALLSALFAGGDDVDVRPGDIDLTVNLTKNTEGPPRSETGAGSPAAAVPQPLPCTAERHRGTCEPITVCAADANSPTGYTSQVFYGYTAGGSGIVEAGPCEPAEAGPSLPNLVLRAFERVPIPAPVLDIQPPKGRTLIGLETIFSTKAPSITRDLTLLGRAVELQIEATGFAWEHGDQTSQTTIWSGIPWRNGLSMDHYITHVYEHTGHVTPRVSVTWSAEYRVDGGPWLPVNGTVTRASQPAALEILEAEPRLVAP